LLTGKLEVADRIDAQNGTFQLGMCGRVMGVNEDKYALNFKLYCFARNVK
jgi:hypothetical protein